MYLGDMNETRTAPTKAQAEILGLPYEAPVGYTAWLTSEAIIRNGGIRPPGTEGMKSQTGSSKPKSKPVVKATVDGGWDDKKTLAENIGTDASKKITRGRVTGRGTYKFGDTVARVQISQSSGKPYALVLRDGNWEYTPGVVKLLKAEDKVEEKASAPKVSVGFYTYGAGVAEVVKTKDGQRLYAKILDVLTGDWSYAPGIMPRLKAEDRLTLSQAAALGKKWHRCMCCGAELTNTDSIDRGIGPVCAGKL
jgi:hypothetical protein